MQRRLALNSPVAEGDLELLTVYILLLGGVILGEHSHTWFVWCWALTQGVTRGKYSTNKATFSGTG